MRPLVAVELLASVLAGWTLVDIAFGSRSRSRWERILRGSIAVLIGLGILSFSFGVAILARLDRLEEAAIPITLAVMGGVGRRWRLGRRARHERAGEYLADRSELPAAPGVMAPVGRTERILKRVFIAACLVTSITAIEHSFREPEGGFDAWAIWNSRARFLFRAEEPAREALSPGLARAQFRTQVDYPLLVPGVVVEGFRLTGRESVAVPAAVALIFGALLASLVTSGIATLLGSRWGLLAGAVLLSTPIFATLAARQCSDLPLASFVFTASLLAALADRSAGRHLPLLVLAGVALSLAAWCKNEGAVFLLAFPIAHVLRPTARGLAARARATEGASWLLGALPVVLLLVAFKLEIGSRNDLVPTSVAEVVGRLFDPARWSIVSVAVGRRLIALQEWGLHLVATASVIGWLVQGRRAGHPSDPMIAPIVWGLVPVALSYLAAYSLTPHDAGWQVRHSFDRLAFQCWPTALFAIFLAAKARADAAQPLR